MQNDPHKLDNPVWHSLNETHQNFAISYEGSKYYHPDYCPFGGFIDIDKTLESNDAYSRLTKEFYVVGEKPNVSNKLVLKKDLVCNQMILDKPIYIEIKEEIIELQSHQSEELFKLVNLIQPGYFKNKTALLGSYYGIYKNNELVAVTGERMKMNDYTEVSAVVTHPDHLGKSYAKQLVAHTTNKIFSENKTPYLHVAKTNTAAINLYVKLGFWTSREISFWNLEGI